MKNVRTGPLNFIRPVSLPHAKGNCRCFLDRSDFSVNIDEAYNYIDEMNNLKHLRIIHGIGSQIARIGFPSSVPSGKFSYEAILRRNTIGGTIISTNMINI